MKVQLAIKKIYIKTYGCQMNFSETEIISGLFLSNGFELTDSMDTADVIILNTCSIRDTAVNKVIGKLGQLKRLKKDNPDLIIGIGGCYAQSDSDFLKKKANYLDFIFGTYNKLRLVDIINKIEESRVLDDYETILDVGVYPDNEQFQYKDIAYKNPVTAWVPIMRGCDNYCSYCIVPYVRGHEISRIPSEIITQIEGLSSQNYKEIVLLGQNVNSYGKRFADGIDYKITFAGLLKELIKIDKIKRIRFITSHPKDLTDELIDVMSSSEKICKSLHLPVQSGSTNVLKAMKRQYSREYYVELIKKLRDKIPDLALATDVIVGFPGETEEDFQLTIDL
ncbi:tRNA (N6-isopentenyl adenosine(37)-C2)-methylthiotransferase MiaB, partial [Candidatus Dependentiae bacterium]|nr:tRNA (N6-isopentenyl adenosine(37)-C2)-methylthiotransferase MiaB [Candidatus Dependentiae bacterium]